VRRARPASIVAAGLALAAMGLAAMTQVDAGSGLALLVVSSVVTDLGLALVVTLSTDLIVGSAPPERAGAASAISETGAELGGALGIAILGSIGTAVYRSEIAHAVPADASAQAAAAARDTLGGAVAVADQLPSSVLQAATEAFTQGLQIAAGTTAAVVAAVAIVAAVLLRGREDRAAEAVPLGAGPVVPQGC
jgi:MFS transporter, DHA2 family, multidrug resistance protein